MPIRQLCHRSDAERIADRLVGKLDATADRPAGVLRVNAVHADVPFTGAIASAVDKNIDELTTWLGLDLAGIQT